MHKSKLLPLLFLALSASPAIAEAPEIASHPESTSRVGIGALIGGGSDGSGGSLTIPIWLGRSVRLEPEVSGQYLRSADRKTSAWNYSLGVGLSATWANGPTRPLVGVRLGTTELGTKTATQKDTTGGLFAGLIVGAEHFVTNSLSLGAEGRLTYAEAGGGGAFSIFGAVAVRLYFE